MRRPPGILIEASEPAYPFDGGLTAAIDLPLAEANHVLYPNRLELCLVS